MIITRTCQLVHTSLAASMVNGMEQSGIGQTHHVPPGFKAWVFPAWPKFPSSLPSSPSLPLCWIIEAGETMLVPLNFSLVIEKFYSSLKKRI